MKNQERLSDFAKDRIIRLNSNGKSTHTIIHKLWNCWTTLNRFKSNFCTRNTFEYVEPTRRKEKSNNDRGCFNLRRSIKVSPILSTIDLRCFTGTESDCLYFSVTNECFWTVRVHVIQDDGFQESLEMTHSHQLVWSLYPLVCQTFAPYFVFWGVTVRHMLELNNLVLLVQKWQARELKSRVDTAPVRHD